MIDQEFENLSIQGGCEPYIWTIALATPLYFTFLFTSFKLLKILYEGMGPNILTIFSY